MIVDTDRVERTVASLRKCYPWLAISDAWVRTECLCMRVVCTCQQCGDGWVFVADRVDQIHETFADAVDLDRILGCEQTEAA